MAYKFGFIFLKGLSQDLESNFSYSFNNNVRFFREIPPIDATRWQEWLGLQWEDVVTSNAVIEVKTETQAPNVLDNENEDLKFTCRELWLSLMLVMPCYLENAYFLTGGESDNRIEVRQFFKFDRWFNLGKDFVQTLVASEISKWKDIFLSLDEVYKKKEDFLRLKRGLLCFLKGCSESNVSFRLPYFVRALEALIIPDKGKTTKQFQSRVAYWWISSKQNKHFPDNVPKTLEDIYDLRCKFEHMHVLATKDMDMSILSSYRCEVLARNAYCDILIDDKKLNMFICDDSIKEFWKTK